MHIGAGNYDLKPTITLDGEHEVWSGQEALSRLTAGLATGQTVVVDCYPGVDVDSLIAQIQRANPGAHLVDVESAAGKSADELATMLDRHLGDGRFLGRMVRYPIEDFFDEARLAELPVSDPDRVTVVVGWGAALVQPEAARLVIVDIARWEIQLRFRAGASNWRAENPDEDVLRKFKRGYFVEWRTADMHKFSLWDRADYWLDANDVDNPKMLRGAAIRAALDQAARRPFRVVPYFDPGPWGGQWVREVCGLDSEPENFAWCFDCVPEENSMLFDVNGTVVEAPAMNLVQKRPKELLGELTHARFGPEFPIRFDMLDTMGGGNLSLQVHPLVGYIRSMFGMSYTQDESYYMLDAAPDAVVYLGTKAGTAPDAMEAALRRAQTGEEDFAAEEFVNTYPARRHDHFLIPAGTVHCSGADSMVLEISATPYIFTFKMWDWGRLGLDGRPRPISIEHAMNNIAWERDDEFCRRELVNAVEPLADGDGWREERTGLHELEFIETRRHWISGICDHNTRGTVHVKNLVAGAEAIIESPTDAFEPFVVHYAETFIVPAAVGRYTVRPYGTAEGQEIATLTAFVRGTER